VGAETGTAETGEAEAGELGANDFVASGIPYAELGFSISAAGVAGKFGEGSFNSGNIEFGRGKSLLRSVKSDLGAGASGLSDGVSSARIKDLDGSSVAAGDAFISICNGSVAFCSCHAISGDSGASGLLKTT
jgi:hypothetical protein